MSLLFDAEGIETAATAVAHGEVIAIPTDTVYGLACDPANADAVARIYAIKRRPEQFELTLLAASRGDLEPFVRFDAAAASLAERFWPGALSIVLPVGDSRLAVPRADGATLSSRVPAHDSLRALLRHTGPLATTSANLHGQRPATDAREAELTVGLEVAHVLDGGPAGGEASTIIDCTTTPPRVLREGPIPSNLLFAHLGPGNQ